MEPLDLMQLIEETVLLAGNQIKLAGAHLDFNFSPDVPRLYGDHQQLSQVLLNILINALDGIPENGHIQITMTQEAPDFVAVKSTRRRPWHS